MRSTQCIKWCITVLSRRQWIISLISTFVFPQIKSESFLEDINSILNSGDVPNLYATDEQERILATMKPVVQDLGQQPTKANLMAAYIRRVRSNIHTVLCMRLVIVQSFVVRKLKEVAKVSPSSFFFLYPSSLFSPFPLLTPLFISSSAVLSVRCFVHGWGSFPHWWHVVP